MGLKLTEEQLNSMLKNNDKLKISKTLGGEIKNKKKSKKILVKDEIEVKEEVSKKKSTGITIPEINKINKSAICTTSVSNDHVSFLFNGAKLLSVNQILAKMQLKFGQKQVFTYKKVWHEVIKSQLDYLFLDLKSKGQKLPFFETSVELTLFRQASRLVDEDAMSMMFKYIIDALKRDDEKNPNGILAEDNPKIVHRIVCFSEKGEPYIGIKIKKIEEKKKQFSPNDILEN